SLWDDGVHGSAMIHIADQASYQAVGQLFLGDIAIKNTLRDSSHQELVESMTRGDSEDQQRLRLRGQAVVLHVLKDGYPRGNTEARDSYMKQDIDPSADWGERHKVGVEMLRLYEDRLFPERRTDWRFAMHLQKRFDKPAAQLEVTSRFDGLIDSRDLLLEEFKPWMSDTRRATQGDLTTMADIFHTAKDIRPYVDRLPILLQKRESWRALVHDFFHGDSAASAQQEAA
ncbi:MAG TPA: hypothetical protein VNG32_02515, partial [Candidatus Dormibacteraeota bacterium]|nr:hypothetical protein [Candidatus Dormibacteraeota bacterium]